MALRHAGALSAGTNAVAPFIAFNPRPQLERMPLGDGAFCYVVDDALREPERFVEHAVAQRAAFQPVDFNAYPGLLLPTPEANAALSDFFIEHVRARFDARRIVHMHSRLALVTLPPQALRPRQQLCHRDSVGIEPGYSIQASVLYLFRDESLGGTSFYASRLDARATALLFHDASTLDPALFAQRYDVPPGYMAGDNRYFERIATIAPRWNRLIFYDGSVLHSGDIDAPEKLSADPARGRLTLNGFFTCRRRTTR